jgi:hypothetical protein
MEDTPEADLDMIAEAIYAAVLELNDAVRLAVEVGLGVKLGLQRQDQQDDRDLVEGAPPAIEVTITRR